MTGLAVSACGAVVVLVTLRDVVLTLFRPEGRAFPSRAVQEVLWGAAMRAGPLRPRLRVLVGPCVIPAVVTVWLALVVVGWALIYWPWMPDDFLVASGLPADAQGGFPDAVYASLVTVATLGYGDLAPEAAWLRIAAPLQALVGFGLLTAAISWTLSVYPALGRRRALAADVALLEGTVGGSGGAVTSASTLDDLRGRLVEAEVDLVQHPVVHYFEVRDERYSLARALPTLAALAEAGGVAGSTDARLAAARLGAAVDALAARLGTAFLGRPGATTAEVLAAHAAERGHRQRAEASARRTRGSSPSNP